MAFLLKRPPHLVTSIVTLTAVAALGLRYYMKKRRKRRPLLYKLDYKKDIVYLYQFPSCRTIPCISPFAMKLETWLRFHKIPYETIRSTKYWSSKGQVPFIEFNGKEIADSNIIMEELGEHFQVKEPIVLTAEQNAVNRAVNMMLDQHTVISYFYYRYVQVPKQFVDTWEFCSPLLRAFIASRFPIGFGKRAYFQGLGRLPKDEIAKIGCRDLQALSNLLGHKPYFNGDQMTSSDFCAFSHLAQILCIPSVDYPQTKYVEENCPNLVAHFERIKQVMWPDWKDICDKFYK